MADMSNQFPGACGETGAPAGDSWAVRRLCLDSAGRIGIMLCCRSCGQDLRGSALDAHCPVCGTPIARSIEPERIAFGPDGRIAADLPCRVCGYNLRGLSPDSPCPECGIPDIAAVRHDLLAFADPDWVETVRRGNELIWWAFLYACLTLVLGLAIVCATGTFGLGFSWILGIAVMVLCLRGVFLLTTSEPPRIGASPPRLPRFAARWLPPIAMLLLAMAGGVAFIERQAGILLLGAGLVFAMLAAAALCLHLRCLAMRTPWPHLERVCAASAVGFGIFPTVGLPALILGIMGAPIGQGAPCVAMAAIPVTLVSAFAAVLLIYRFRDEFAIAATAAQAGAARPLRATVPIPGEES